MKAEKYLRQIAILGLKKRRKKDIVKHNSIIATLDMLSEFRIEPYNVFCKIYVLGLSYKEITLEMDKSVSWVRDNGKIGRKGYGGEKNELHILRQRNHR